MVSEKAELDLFFDESEGLTEQSTLFLFFLHHPVGQLIYGSAGSDGDDFYGTS